MTLITVTASTFQGMDTTIYISRRTSLRHYFPCFLDIKIEVKFNFQTLRKKIMASWGCPHEIAGQCTHLNNLACDPGMKGCVLAGRFVFINSDEKSARFREKQARASSDRPDPKPEGNKKD